MIGFDHNKTAPGSAANATEGLDHRTTAEESITMACPDPTARPTPSETLALIKSIAAHAIDEQVALDYIRAALDGASIDDLLAARLRAVR